MRSAGALALGWVLFVGCGGPSDDVLAQFNLDGIKGPNVSASVLDGATCLVVCGCQPCVDAASGISRRGDTNIVLLGQLPVPEMRKFVQRTAWGGVAYSDPGSRLSIHFGLLSCPKRVRFSRGSIQHLDLPIEERSKN